MALLCACSDDPQTGKDTTTPTDTDVVGEVDDVAADVEPDAADTFEWPLATIDWQPCEATDGTPLECADVPVPLDWDDPASTTMTVGVTRNRGAEPVDVHLWIVGGGPGQSVVDGIDVNYLVGMRQHLADAAIEAALYDFDQRGSGRSSRLSCVAAEGPETVGGANVWVEEYAACGAELSALGDLLDAFQPARTARDLDHLIRSTRAPGEKVFVQGGSFGSDLALRYLIVDPDGVDGVILSAVMTPTSGGLWSRMWDAEEAGKNLMAECAADAICGARLGPDPYARLVDVFRRVRAGEHCTDVLAADPNLRSMQRAFKHALDNKGRMPLVAAMTYRLERCEPRDVDAIAAVKELFDASPYEDFEPQSYLARTSRPLAFLVNQSELPDEGHPLAEAEYVAARDTLHFLELLPENLAFGPHWPTYEPDPGFVGVWPEPTMPILVINGTLDNRTPLSDAELAATELGANARLVSMPYTGHTVMRTSFQEGSDVPCAMELALQFVKDPTAELDLSCRDRLVEPNYDDDELAQDFFLADDLWE